MTHHYVKLMRDASVMLDAVIFRLTEERPFALLSTDFTFTQTSVRVRPNKPEDREAVFTIAVEEFTRAGWHYGSTMADAEDDPKRPVVAMTFNHPVMNTYLGNEGRPTRPYAMGFEVPMPYPSVPITKDLIDYYAERTAEIVRGLLSQQVVKEEFKMPGTPGQGVDNPHYRPPNRPAVSPPVKPLYQAKPIESDDDGDW